MAQQPTRGLDLYHTCSNSIHHHGMVRPQVTYTGDGLQIWSVDANVLTSSRGQPKRGDPQDWALGEGLAHPHRIKKLVMKRYTGLRIG